MTTNITTVTIPTTSLVIASNIEKAQNIIARLESDELTKGAAHKALEKIAKTTFVDIEEAKAFFTPKSDEAPNTLPNVENSDINTQQEAKVETSNTEGSNEKDAFRKRCEACKGEIKICDTSAERYNVALKFSPLFAAFRKAEKGQYKGIKALIYELHLLGFTDKDILGLSIYEKDEKLALMSINDAIRKTKQDLGLVEKGTRSTAEGTIRAKVTTLEGMRRAIDAKKERIATLQAEILEDEKAYTLQIESEKEAAKEAAKNTLSAQIAKFKELGMSVEDILALINA